MFQFLYQLPGARRSGAGFAEATRHGGDSSARAAREREAPAKENLARYVEEVGDRLLPHLQNRPLSLVRCPDGVAGECFYQRHLAMAARPGSLQTVKRQCSSTWAGYWRTRQAVTAKMKRALDRT